MEDETGPFVFPTGMAPEHARQVLAQAYGKVNAGRVVRRTIKRARSEGFDPPFDVGYVAEPAVVAYEEGLGVDLGADILLYDEFPGWRRCLEIFEEEVSDALMRRLEALVRRWVRRRGPKN